MYVHRTRALKWNADGKIQTKNVNKKLYNKILKIIEEGFEISYEVIKTFESETECLQFEASEISRIGLNILCNLTSGGEGETKSPESLEKMSSSMKKFWESPEGLNKRKELSETRKGANNPMYGTVEDDEHKQLRMANMLAQPRWNKGKSGDPRCKGAPKGNIPHNARTCLATCLLTGKIVRADTMVRLAHTIDVPVCTLVRMLTIPNYYSRKWSNLWKVEFE